MQERYRKLAVLIGDTSARLLVMQTLWNVSQAEARRIGRQLVDRSLAQQGSEGLRLHDLQLRYVRAQYSDPETFDLLHGASRLRGMR